MEEKTNYQKTIEEKLRHFSDSIVELTGKTEKLQAGAKAECQKQIETLRSRQGTLREKLRQLEESGDEAWEDLKEGIEHAWKDLTHALDSALSRFKSENEKPTEGGSQ